uniref:Lipoyl-binding domain-containing protein n=1 Tax=Ditylenchus dipsaci TaxID=166011 RepID=A0A915D4I4_9BILA
MEYCGNGAQDTPLDNVKELFLVTSISKSLSPIAQRPVLHYTLERVATGKRWSSKAIQLKDSILICGSKTYKWDLPVVATNVEEQQESLGPVRSEVLSPIPGVVTKILTAVGEAVKKGQELATLTSMKMEFVIRAPCDGTVKSMECKLGQAVRKNYILIKFDNPISTE